MERTHAHDLAKVHRGEDELHVRRGDHRRTVTAGEENRPLTGWIVGGTIRRVRREIRSLTDGQGRRFGPQRHFLPFVEQALLGIEKIVHDWTVGQGNNHVGLRIESYHHHRAGKRV